MAGSTLAIIGLTWGGVRYPWKSAQVLVPLLVGIALILSFVICEAFVPKLPTIPFKVLTNRTTIGGYVTSHLSQTLIAKSGLYQIHRNTDTWDYKYLNHMCVFLYPVHNLTLSILCEDYMPVYFQASLDWSPLRSSVQTLPTALIISPFALLSGIFVKVLRRYRPSNILGWLLTVVGFGLLILLKADSSTSQWVGYQILSAAGTGMIASGNRNVQMCKNEGG